MRRASELIGKPIIVSQTGERCAVVSDLIIDQHSRRLLGFIVDDGATSRGMRVIALESLELLDEEGLYVPAKSALVTTRHVPEIRRVIRRRTTLRGTAVESADGRDLGQVLDVYFDEDGWGVAGLLISGGNLSGLFLGEQSAEVLRTIQGADVAEECEEAEAQPPAPVEIPDHPLEQLSSFAEISEDIQVEYDKLFGDDKTVHWDIVASDGTVVAREGEPVTREIAERAAHYGLLGDLFWAVGGRAVEDPELPAAPTLHDAEGLTARRTLRASRGLLIVAEGHVVTQQVIERAQLYRKEEELLEAVGLLSEPDLPPRPEEELEWMARQAQTRLRRGWQQVKSLLGGLRPRRRRRTIDASQAIGRRVSAPIYGPDAQLIVADGEEVTAEIVEHARAAGALDGLLDALASHPEPLSLEDKGLDEELEQAELTEKNGAPRRSGAS